jgi:hypothetical protein
MSTSQNVGEKSCPKFLRKIWPNFHRKSWQNILEKVGQNFGEKVGQNFGEKSRPKFRRKSWQILCGSAAAGCFKQVSKDEQTIGKTCPTLPRPAPTFCTTGDVNFCSKNVGSNFIFGILGT